MPAASAVLAPVCAVLALIGLALTVVFFVRRRPGRALQAFGLAVFAAALWLTELFPVVWDFVVAIVDWTTRAAFGPRIWFGLGLLVLAVVLWAVGGLLAGRAKVRSRAEARAQKVERREQGTVGAGRSGTGTSTGTAPAGRQAVTTGKPAKRGAQPAADPEMDEIEALLKSRGIE